MEELYTQPGVPEQAEKETVKQARRFFSNMGLMFLAGTLCIYAIQYKLSGLIYAIRPEILQNPDILLLFSSVSMYVLGMPLMIMLVHTIPKEKIQKRSMTVGKFLVALIICYGIMYASNLIGSLITYFLAILKGKPIDNYTMELAGSASLWVRILIMVIWAPIMEELIFRKILVDRVVRYGEGAAVVLSGLMFGLFHGNLSQFAYASTIGMFFAFIYVKTGRLQYTIIMHMVVNFLGGVLSLFMLDLVDLEELQSVMAGGGDLSKVLPGLLVFMLYMFCLIGIVVAGIVLLIVYRKRMHLNAGRIALPRGKRFLTMICNAGMGLFFLYWVVEIVLQIID
ncbi:MAG: CPBP family intramembrane metalloprotease [Lachnospiraceae bacterium]|nr:CPBP family intramembrane metalloprotease [Lachnospiraceae bacterium]